MVVLLDWDIGAAHVSDMIECKELYENSLGNACRVDENVRGSELCNDGADGVVDGVTVADVNTVELNRNASELVKLGSTLIAKLLVGVEDD